MGKLRRIRHFKIELKWAIIATILSLSWMLLEKTLGWHDEQIADHYWLTLMFIPFIVLMYVLCIREKRRRVFNKKLTWRQGFFTGARLALIITLLSPLAQYITHNYITPKYFEKVKEYSITNELMTVRAANDYFNIGNYIWQAAAGALIGGVVIAAIVALFLKKK